MTAAVLLRPEPRSPGSESPDRESAGAPRFAAGDVVEVEPAGAPGAALSARTERLEAYLHSVAELQSGHTAASRLMKLTATEDFDMREVVRCVECDPALTAKLLRVVNGSSYGLRHRVSGVRRAAAYIGRRSLRLLAVTFCLTDRFKPDRPLHQAVWRRAVVSAAAAAELAKGVESSAIDEAYTAGLLSDLGAMLLGGFDPAAYPGLHLRTSHDGKLLQAERERYGVDHATLGSRFLEIWGLPEELVSAAAGHHLEPHEAPADGSEPAALDVIVRVADRIAQAALTPTKAAVRSADELIRERFPSRLTSRVLTRALAAVQEDADLYPGVETPDVTVTTVEWAKYVDCPELILAAAGKRSEPPNRFGARLMANSIAQ